MLYEGLSFNESKFIDKLNRVEIFKSKLPYKITNNHIEYTREYLINNFAKLITIASLKTYLDTINNLQKLSKSGVRHLLKNVLKYSYKSAHGLSK